MAVPRPAPPWDADVAVVGCGPVGATVALLLAGHGVRTLVLERSEHPSTLPRAVALDDEALRILQAAAVPDPLGPSLLVGPGVCLRGRRQRPLLHLPLNTSPLGHPALAFVHQPDLQSALERRLSAQAAVRLWRGVEVTAIAQDESGVILHRRGAAPLRARFVLGCDGASGVVRRALGVRLRGVSSPRRWLVVDARVPAVTGREPAPFSFDADPHRPSVNGPLPGARHRWEFMLGPQELAAAMLEPAMVSRLLAEAGAPPAVLVERAAVYSFHARVATRWRDGRVLLLGDAAHLSPPFAGQGLGAGLRDAVNLAWKLGAVLQGEAGEGLLDTYAQERRAHVRRMNALALALGAAVQARQPRLASIRDGLAATVLKRPGVANWTRGGGWKPVARLPRRSRQATRFSHHLAGRLLPQPLLRSGVSSGGVRRLDDIIGPRFALIGLDVRPPAATLRGRAGTDLDLARLVLRPARAGGKAQPGEFVEVDDALSSWWECARGRVVLLRPDRYAYAVVAPEDTGRALRSLGRHLERKPRPRRRSPGSPGLRPRG